MTHEREPWQSPELHMLSIGMDTALQGGSGIDGEGFSGSPTPTLTPAPPN